jgi:hypothetical protein
MLSKERHQTATGPFTKLYEEIRAGRLVATKIGRRTVILDDDLKAWLSRLPKLSTQ